MLWFGFIVDGCFFQAGKRFVALHLLSNRYYRKRGRRLQETAGISEGAAKEGRFPPKGWLVSRLLRLRFQGDGVRQYF